MNVRRAGGATIGLALAALPVGALAQRADPPTAAPAASSAATASSAPIASSAPPVSSAPAASSAAPAPSPVAQTLVEFDSDRPRITVYVAPGALTDTEPRYPDPFVKIGMTPVATKLAPGVYTVTVESPDISIGKTILQVGSEPVHVRVRSGSDSMRNLGTLLIAGGAASLLTALAIEVSYSSAPNGISKSKIAIPLLVVGGVGAAAGLTFYLTSATTIEHDGPKPDRRGAMFNVTTRW